MRLFRLTPARRPIAALRKIEESPWTRNWDHLAPVRMKAWKIAKMSDPKFPEAVPVRDRIKQWNIVPGDRIRVRDDPESTIMEVFGINKFRNLVFLKARQETPTNPDERPIPPSVPYSTCQLYIGEREFPPLPGETKPRVAPVFASRLGCTFAKFAVNLGRFDWERFALQTVPRLNDSSEKIKIVIPWPKPTPPSIPPIEATDTPADVVKEITWRPSPLFYPPSNASRSRLLQNAYLRAIRASPGSGTSLEYNQETLPALEYVIGDELSNPHSRAKKQRRAREYIAARERAHEEFVQAELTDLDGRTHKEALAEAEWKWTELRRKENEALRKKQWVQRGGAERLKWRRFRKERKERQQVERMRNLVLEPARNQILPTSQPLNQVV